MDRKLGSLIGSLVAVVLFGAVVAAGEGAESRAVANFTVTVTVQGNGNGFVFDGAGILRCGIGTSRRANDVCSRTLPEEHVPYFLGASPEKDSVWGPWTGCDRIEGNGQTCVIIEAGDRTVNATISLPSPPSPPTPPPPTPPPAPGPSPEVPPFTPEEKKALEKVETIYDGESDIFFGLMGISAILVLTPAAPLAVPLVVGFGALGIVMRAGGVVMGVLAKDPPDSRFWVIARPRVARLVRITPTRALAPPAASALSRLVNTSLRLNATLDALLPSFERAQGAAAAGNRVWVVRQRKAAARHARAAAALLDQMASLRAATARTIGRDLVRATPRQVRLARDRVRAVGLSQQTKIVLRRAGASRAVIVEIERGVKRAKLPLARVRFPAVLLNPRLRAAERDAARMLRRFASRAARTP